MRRPFFRSATLSWYVELENGRQVPLGKDPRFKVPPEVKPKEPPPAIFKKYLAVMQRQAEPEDRLLSFCIDAYLRSLEGCTERTRYRARHFLERLLAEAGDLKVSQLRKHHLTEFLKGKPWKPNTVYAFLSAVGACLNYCEREDWIPRNPLRGKLDRPAIQRRAEVMSREDKERVLEAAEGCFQDALLFLAGTGCRPIELRSARVEKCDLEKGILLVPNKTRKKTNAQERPIFLSTVMIDLCRRLIAGRGEGWLFRNAYGNAWTQTALEHRILNLCQKLGITKGATLYSFRHGWISEAINLRGMNPAMVAIQAGHTDLKMLLKHYLHADHEAMRKALDQR